MKSRIIQIIKKFTPEPELTLTFKAKQELDELIDIFNSNSHQARTMWFSFVSITNSKQLAE